VCVTATVALLDVGATAAVDSTEPAEDVQEEEAVAPTLLLLPLLDGVPLTQLNQLGLARALLGDAELDQFGLRPTVPATTLKAQAGMTPPADSWEIRQGELFGEDARTLAALELPMVMVVPSAARQLFVTLHVGVLASSQGGTATVHHWEEVSTEQRAAMAPALVGALRDLQKRSPAAALALVSKAEVELNHIRNSLMPLIAGAITVLAVGGSGAGMRDLRLLAQNSSAADARADAEATILEPLLELLEFQLASKKARRRASSSNPNGRRRRGAKAASDEPDDDPEEEDDE